MTKAELLKLNALISLFYNRDVKTNSYLMQIKDYCFQLCQETLTSYDKQNFQGPFSQIYYEKSINLVSNFLETINSQYAKEFYQDIAHNKIIMQPQLANQFIRKDNDYYITINKTNTLEDAYSLLHEYVHKLLSNFQLPYITAINKNFSELITRYSELLFSDYLLNNKLASPYEINMLKDQIRDTTYINLCNYLIEYPLINWLANKHTITEDFYNYNKDRYQQLGITEQYFDQLMKNLLAKKNLTSSLINYKYILGLTMASYFHDYSQISLEKLITASYQDLPIIEFLNVEQLKNYQKINTSLKNNYGH